MRQNIEIKVGKRLIGLNYPTYFIADIAANHDGDLKRAKELIRLAKIAKADCVKFQHFKASQIVSDLGFKKLGSAKSHQAKWVKSVYQTYEQYELNREWDTELVKTAVEFGIDFMTTPYDTDAVDTVDYLVSAWKIGSGDITFIPFVEYVARTKKPIMIATGASTLDDVDRLISAISPINRELVLMQCNTNYTGSIENFKYINLNVLKTYHQRYPEVILGLSDHSPGNATVLGAISLGARVIEKHFTDDTSRAGPDHAFAMDPITWKDMVLRSRELEAALGDGIKRVENNEIETAVLQQRCLRAKKQLAVGHIITPSDLQALRPATPGAFKPYQFNEVIGSKLKVALELGEALKFDDIENIK
jgi:sialic acid synthase SpsE